MMQEKIKKNDFFGLSDTTNGDFLRYVALKKRIWQNFIAVLTIARERCRDVRAESRLQASAAFLQSAG